MPGLRERSNKTQVHRATIAVRTAAPQFFLFTLGEGGEVATNAIRVNVAAYFDFLLLRVSQQKDRSKKKKNNAAKQEEHPDARHDLLPDA